MLARGGLPKAKLRFQSEFRRHGWGVLIYNCAVAKHPSYRKYRSGALRPILNLIESGLAHGLCHLRTIAIPRLQV
jgi:hypothetical protein